MTISVERVRSQYVLPSLFASPLHFLGGGGGIFFGVQRDWWEIDLWTFRCVQVCCPRIFFSTLGSLTCDPLNWKRRTKLKHWNLLSDSNCKDGRLPNVHCWSGKNNQLFLPLSDFTVRIIKEGNRIETKPELLELISSLLPFFFAFFLFLLRPTWAGHQIQWKIYRSVLQEPLMGRYLAPHTITGLFVLWCINYYQSTKRSKNLIRNAFCSLADRASLQVPYCSIPFFPFVSIFPPPFGSFLSPTVPRFSSYFCVLWARVKLDPNIIIVNFPYQSYFLNHHIRKYLKMDTTRLSFPREVKA